MPASGTANISPAMAKPAAIQISTATRSVSRRGKGGLRRDQTNRSSARTSRSTATSQIPAAAARSIMVATPGPSMVERDRQPLNHGARRREQQGQRDWRCEWRQRTSWHPHLLLDCEPSLALS